MCGYLVRIAFFGGGRDPRGETQLLFSICMIGTVVLLILLAKALYCYRQNKQKRSDHGLSKLSRMEALQRTPYVSEILIGTFTLACVIYPCASLSAASVFDIRLPLQCLPFVSGTGALAGLLYWKINKKRRR